MNIAKLSVLAVAVGILAACSANGRLPGQSPIVIDTRGVNMTQYRNDLADCENYAKQISVGDKVATQAAIGAVLGGAVGAIFDGSEGARHVGGSGAVMGGAGGASKALSEKDRVVKQCLIGRGYKVLN